eukprot:522382-Prymnesium_polylepis.1
MGNPSPHAPGHPPAHGTHAATTHPPADHESTDKDELARWLTTHKLSLAEHMPMLEALGVKH